MLEPLKSQNQPIEEIQRKCECCSKIFDSSTGLNIMMIVGSAGHKDLPPFQCPNEEHWACCLECWLKVAHACIDEHIFMVLKLMHVTLAQAIKGGNQLPPENQTEIVEK